MAITAEEFIKLSSQEVEISGFTKGEKIKVLLKDVSLTSMMIDGRVPNELVQTVEDVFAGSTPTVEEAQKVAKNFDSDKIREMMSLMDVVCREAMVQPKYDEVKNYMTDEQKNDIFAWTQRGIQELKPSYKEQADALYSSNL